MIKAKKSLGQNFLIDSKVLELISNLEDLNNKIILEVGPGTGNLTSYLIEKNPKEIIVVEKDNNLVDFLKNRFGIKIKIINDDILKVEENNLSSQKIVVFGNLPYNISTEILTKWILNINNNFWFHSLILMFQKEVADRIIAEFNSSDYGRLTILANWKLNIKKIIDIKPESFNPKPKIDSTLLYFTPKENFIELNNPKNLEHITRIFFSHRRKMIKKPFNQVFNGDKNILNKFDINLNLRPQNLNFETYLKLTREFEKLRG